jgi:hypothetical protein
MGQQMGRERFGLLQPEQLKKRKHICSPPSLLWRLVRRFFGSPIPLGSLYRCRCLKMYRLIEKNEGYDAFQPHQYWIAYSNIETWIKLGGRE